jgi:hypothetical protein
MNAPPRGVPGLSFHHFGLAVREPEEAFRYLQSIGYSDGLSVFDPLQRVNLAMRHHPLMPDVEVIWPGPAPSPIDKMIKRSGAMIYHICYTCTDPQAVLAALHEAEVDTVLVSPPTPALLFGGRAVSFHMVSGFGMIELLRSGAEVS